MDIDLYACAHGKPFAVNPATGRIEFSTPCFVCERELADEPPVIVPKARAAA